jgi:hypothetical protein
MIQCIVDPNAVFLISMPTCSPQPKLVSLSDEIHYLFIIHCKVILYRLIWK